MARISFFGSAGLVAALLCLGAAQGAGAADLTLHGVTVVSTLDGRLTPNMDVIIAGDRIVGISPAKPGKPASHLKVIDARGKYVVPGYLDMHSHALVEGDPTGALQLMLANGVTGFRQMSGSPELLAQRKAGTLPIPKDGSALLAMPGTILTPGNAATEEAAIAAIREQKAAGADFIKVGLVTPKVFFPAQAEARRLGIPIVGHLPTGIDVIAASKGGMKSIEHLGPGVGILAACSTDETAVRQLLAKAPEPRFPTLTPAMLKMLEPILKKKVINPLADSGEPEAAILHLAESTFSAAKCRALAAHFVADGTWQSPTLIRVKTSELGDTPEFQTDPNLRYMNPATVQGWLAATHQFAKLPASARATFRETYAVQLKLTKLFDDAHVKMLAGSDASGAAWEVPGFALHQEFDELARAGLPPLHVLQMTTINGAEFLGMTRDLGSVAKGKLAELVLLDANPIESVQNLHRIAAVVHGGTYYSSADLEALKARVAAAKSVN